MGIIDKATKIQYKGDWLLERIEDEKAVLLENGMIPIFLVMDARHYRALNEILRQYFVTANTPNASITRYSGLEMVVVPSFQGMAVLPAPSDAARMVMYATG